MQLVGCELELDWAAERESIVRGLGIFSGGPLLVLNTCQRLEVYGLGFPAVDKAQIIRSWSDADAFERLARIAAGLESRILGELEILGQVREAYRRFLECGGSDAKALDRVFQDALSLARKARRVSKIDQTLTSLSALAVKEFEGHLPAGAPVAVVGSGMLASSVARNLSKRGSSPVRIAGRCPENALRLAAEVKGFAGGLEQLAPLFDGVAGIVTATAAPHPLVYPQHLEHAHRPLVIVDLGVPLDCSPEVARMADVHYVPLSDIEAKADISLDERRQKAEVAARVIREGARQWADER